MPCFVVLRVFCERTLRGVDVDLCGQFQEIFFTEITAVAFNHINHLLVAVVRCACVLFLFFLFILSFALFLSRPVFDVIGALDCFACYLCAYICHFNNEFYVVDAHAS